MGNSVKANNGFEAIFGEDKRFSVVCNKCGSTDIEIICTEGIDHGDEYEPLSITVICVCGIQITL